MIDSESYVILQELYDDAVDILEVSRRYESRYEAGIQIRLIK